MYDNNRFQIRSYSICLKRNFVFVFIKGCIITENICEFCSVSALVVLGEGNRNDKILKCHFVQK